MASCHFHLVFPLQSLYAGWEYKIHLSVRGRYTIYCGSPLIQIISIECAEAVRRTLSVSFVTDLDYCVVFVDQVLYSLNTRIELKKLLNSLCQTSKNRFSLFCLPFGSSSNHNNHCNSLHHLNWSQAKFGMSCHDKTSPGSAPRVVFVLRAKVLVNTILEHYLPTIVTKTIHALTGLPMMHGLRIFDALELKFTPLKSALCVELTLEIGKWGVCLLSKILHYVSAWKSGNGFPLVRHRYHSCDLGKSTMLSAQLYTLCFEALWSSGSETYNIMRSHVHYTLQSKSKTLHSK